MKHLVNVSIEPCEGGKDGVFILQHGPENELSRTVRRFPLGRMFLEAEVLLQNALKNQVRQIVEEQKAANAR